MLLLCMGNSARNQMTEGLLRHPAGDRYDVSTAWTHPFGLNPSAEAAMQELRIDISSQRSKSMDESIDQAFDCVITVCNRAKDSCPRWPHTGRLMHRSFDDPAAAMGSLGDRKNTFRTVRDQIKARLEWFITSP
jgi:arsenate reductase (thioredoxin)